MRYDLAIWRWFLQQNPSFATTKVRVRRSDIGATGPMHASNEAILGKVTLWKSEAEVLLIRGCEAVLFTVDPKYWPDGLRLGTRTVGLLEFLLFRLLSH